jgi:lysozyme family protein
MALDTHRREHANPSNRRLRNLAKRPARPAYRNGRVQRMVERAIEALRLANTVEIMKWAYVERLHRGEGFERHHYRAALRALRQMGAVPFGRSEGRGRPLIWRMLAAPFATEK